MKILFIHHLFTPYGGGEKIFYNGAQAFKKNGHEVFYFTTDKTPFFEPDYEYSKYFPKFTDYKSQSKFEQFKNMPKALYNFEAQKKLDALLSKIKPDIIHCHNISFYLTPSILKTCYKYNIPTVMTMHMPRLMCPAGNLLCKAEKYCNNEICIGKNPLPCILNRCKDNSLSASIMATVEILFKKIYNPYDKLSALIFPSQALLELAVRAGFKREKLFMVNNFIDDSFFESQPNYSSGEYFLYVGRLEKVKGVQVLIKAMSKLPGNIKLHIVGTGSYENELKNLACNLNLPNVKFLGLKSGNELQDQYKNCIASIVPSIWFEVFGLTVAESLAQGKCVIGSNSGGIPEVLGDDNKCGFIFNPEDENKLAKTINKLYNDKKLAVELGKNARKRAEKLYFSQTYYAIMQELFKNIIKNHTR